jgi:hypothetical protein
MVGPLWFYGLCSSPLAGGIFGAGSWTRRAHLVSGVDQPVQERLGDHWFGEQTTQSVDALLDVRRAAGPHDQRRGANSEPGTAGLTQLSNAV